MLTRRFAMELGSDEITVNAVAPVFVRTDMTQGTSRHRMRLYRKPCWGADDSGAYRRA